MDARAQFSSSSSKVRNNLFSTIHTIFYLDKLTLIWLFKSSAFNTVNAEVKVGEYDGVTETLSLMIGQNITWNGKQPPKDRTFTVSPPDLLYIDAIQFFD